MAVLIEKNTDGHRPDYRELFKVVLHANAIPVTVSSGGWRAIVARPPLFYLLIEDSFGEFFFAASFRAILGRPTIGLLFRPVVKGEARSLRLRAKYFCLRLLRAFPAVSAMTILPFELRPELSQVARFGLPDPTLWDIGLLRFWDASTPAAIAISKQISALAAGRRIIAALGWQSRIKGFRRFCQIWRDCPDLHQRFLFVAGGIVTQECRPDAQKFAEDGGVLIDRELQASEMDAVYDSADLIWCCYAPEYDQASGIFGRAFQRGIPTLLRKGSNLEALAAVLGHPAVALPWDESSPVTEYFNEIPPAQNPDVIKLRVNAIRQASSDILGAVLGVPVGISSL